MKRKDKEEMAPQKKKMIAFKSTPTISDKDDEDDKDLSILVKNVKRMYKIVKFNNRRRWQGKEEKKIICFNYPELGHIVAECPKTKSKLSTSKKALKVT